MGVGLMHAILVSISMICLSICLICSLLLQQTSKIVDKNVSFINQLTIIIRFH